MVETDIMVQTWYQKNKIKECVWCSRCAHSFSLIKNSNLLTRIYVNGCVFYLERFHPNELASLIGCPSSLCLCDIDPVLHKFNRLLSPFSNDETSLDRKMLYSKLVQPLSKYAFLVPDTGGDTDYGFTRLHRHRVRCA